jgi:hypothetical protein
MKNLFLPFVLLLILSTAYSCKKEEGEGGQARILGRVYSYDINKSFQKTDSGYIADTRVFIAYGNEGLVDDDTRTSFDGSFEFNWLQKGNYTVWVIGQCDTCPAGQVVDSVRVVISDKKQSVATRDLITYY